MAAISASHTSTPSSGASVGSTIKEKAAPHPGQVKGTLNAGKKASFIPPYVQQACPPLARFSTERDFSLPNERLFRGVGPPWPWSGTSETRREPVPVRAPKEPQRVIRLRFRCPAPSQPDSSKWIRRGDPMSRRRILLTARTRGMVVAQRRITAARRANGVFRSESPTCFVGLGRRR